METAGFIASSFGTLPRFRLVRATTVAEALDALASADDVAILAGGTDLPARFNEGFAPSTVVDISRIEPLQRIELRDGALVIGAGVTHAFGATHPLIREHLPSFGRAWSGIANVRIRMSATLGGNLMARRTRYEGAILLTALGARARLSTPSVRDGVELPIELCSFPDGVLLTAIVIPLRKGLRLDYERSLRPVMTQAVALDASGEGRVVTATEFIRPRVQNLRGGTLAATSASPAVFGDPVTSDDYLRRMQGVFLARQLERMRAA